VVALVYGAYWAYTNYYLSDEGNLPKVTEEQKNNQKVDDVIIKETNGELGFEQFVPGNWKSDEDSMSQMILKADGTVENIYNGDSVSFGTWTTEGYKLKIMDEGEEFVYTVIFAGSKRLELTYLETGDTLNFVRMTE